MSKSSSESTKPPTTGAELISADIVADQTPIPYPLSFQVSYIVFWDDAILKLSPV